MKAMTQALTRDVEDLIARQISEGNYRSFDEVLAALRSVITDQRILDRLRAAWLRSEIARSDETGGEIPAKDVFDAARARIKDAR